MKFYPANIPGLIVLEPRVLEDERGYFFESFNERNFAEAGIPNRFVQDNQSCSHYGVIRGLHYQLAPYGQAKLVRVLEGTILDVAVDIRQGSPWYGQSFALEMSAENKKQLFIPSGFAHGFSVLSNRAVILYKCDAFYNRESEAGIRFDDPALQIDWKIPAGRAIVSEKDSRLPVLAACRNNFVYPRA
ncbi:MAG TPA: dTDP-4-dehydrorhamnose 3,5-epimerase [Chitinophagaceae bacterium]|nr:dTDP-4-dehydrorhamnose 3,5-epimerase [Chitinophagaceae bacterium]